VETPSILYSELATEPLQRYCRATGINRVVIVSDANTYAVAGQEVVRGLQSIGVHVRSVILPYSGVYADADSILTVLTDIDTETDALISIGSGTITDITRFVSHRMNKRFVAVATAPSVDGFTSDNSPLLIRGYKETIPCHTPEAIVAPLKVLSSAPSEMIAAGFGDVIGKATAIADWKLSRLLVDAQYDQEIADVAIAALHRVIAVADQLATRDPEAVRILFDSLIDTGNTIRFFGSSAPASGSEHHVSHFIEMLQIAQGKPSILHGAKVGVGTVVAAEWYEKLRSLTRAEVERLLPELPDFDKDNQKTRELLGEAGALIFEKNDFIHTLTNHTVHAIRSRLLENWDSIQDIAASVPPAKEIQSLLRRVHGPTTAKELGVTDKELDNAARLGHYVRSRFTVRTLLFVLGIPNDDLTPQLAL
jgi:glycerol-1-phosphate dehydrogenase [NAD(P)+]